MLNKTTRQIGVIGLMAVVIVGLVAHLMFQAPAPLFGQEDGTGAPPETASATSTPVASTEASESATTTREVCVEDPETGEMECFDSPSPSLEIRHLTRTSNNGDRKPGPGPRYCYTNEEFVEVCTEELRLSDLATTRVVNTDDSFTLTAEPLDRGVTYAIRVFRETGNDAIGFVRNNGAHDSCAYSQVNATTTPAVAGTSYIDTYTLHACRPTNGDPVTVTVELVRSGDLIYWQALDIEVIGPPPTPAGFSAVASSDTSVDLTWDEVDGAAGYRFQRRSGTDDWPTGSTEVTATGAEVSDLTCNTRYYFRVSAMGDGATHQAVWGDWSAEADTTTSACVPDPPSVFTFSPEPLDPGDTSDVWEVPLGVSAVYLDVDFSSGTSLDAGTGNIRVERVNSSNVVQETHIVEEEGDSGELTRVTAGTRIRIRVDNDAFDSAEALVTLTFHSGSAAGGHVVARARVQTTAEPTLDLTPTVRISASPSEITEGEEITFTVTGTDVPAGGLVVGVNVTEVGDYIEGATTTAVTIPSGQTTASFVVATENDGELELNGSVTATITNDDHYDVVAPPSSTVPVKDDDPFAFTPEILDLGEASGVWTVPEGVSSVYLDVDFSSGAALDTGSGDIRIERVDSSDNVLETHLVHGESDADEISGVTEDSRVRVRADTNAHDSMESLVTLTFHSGSGTDGQVIARARVQTSASTAPVPQITITGSQSLSYQEHATGAVATYDTSSSLPGVSWSLSGDDAGLFSIGNGTLSFSGPPDYESPEDNDEDNVYDVTVNAAKSDYTSGSIAVTIQVRNVDEQGSVSLSTTSPRVGRTVAASLADADGGVSNSSWQWEKSPSGETWAQISGATSGSYRAVEGDLGSRLRATVSYDDGHGSGKSAISPATSEVTPPPVVDITLQFAEDSYGVREGNDLTVNIELNPATDRVLMIPVTISGGSATGTDYTITGLPDGKLEIARQAGSASFTVSANHDDDLDNKTLSFGFGDMPARVSVGPNSTATVTIQDDAVPIGLDVFPTIKESENKVKIVWSSGAEATNFMVERRPTGEDEYWTNPEATATSGHSLLIDLDDLYGDRGLGDSPYSYELRVKATGGDGGLADSEYSETIAIVGNPIIRVDGDSRLTSSMSDSTSGAGQIEVKWKASISTQVADHEIRWRKLPRTEALQNDEWVLVDHDDYDWKLTPADSADDWTTHRESATTTYVIREIVGSVGDQPESLEPEKLYAIQINYVTPSGQRVFSGLESYAWPSARAGGNGERVATYPLRSVLKDRRYEYHICGDTFSTNTARQGEWTTLINHAMGRWQSATDNLVELIDVTDEHTDKEVCFDFKDLTASTTDAVLREIPERGSRLTLAEREQIREIVEGLLTTARFERFSSRRTDEDMSNEILMLDDSVYDGYKNSPYSEISFEVAHGSCGRVAPACAVHTAIFDDGRVVRHPVEVLDEFTRGSGGGGGGELSRSDVSFYTDIVLYKMEYGEEPLDLPSDPERFRGCGSMPKVYSVVLHEAGHALGITISDPVVEAFRGQTTDLVHPPKRMGNTSMRTINCTLSPLDVTAVFALYQTFQD